MPDYPGLGLPLNYSSQTFYPTAIGSISERYSGLLTVRELAMMTIMEKLTDKEDWEKKVFDEEIVSKWRTEALEYPDELLWQQAGEGKNRASWTENASGSDKSLKGIMSPEAFDYCVQELRSKARYYEKTGLIPTLDACATVVKSDKLVSLELQTQLRGAFDALKYDQAASPDWHPNSSEMVQDLLHPSMYPLVYGRSRGVKDELVGVLDAINKWTGKGEIIPKDHSSLRRDNHWSDTYQWLPSNLAFQDDGGVRFTSYINNLHPNKYTDIYRTIEKLIETVLPAWDQCLVFYENGNQKARAGRTKLRIPIPSNPDDDNPENWDPPSAKAMAEMKLRASDEDASDSDGDIEVEGSVSSDESEDDYELREQWEEARKPVQPQPDFFSIGDDYYIPEEGYRLTQKFKNTGLQVIIKMASIELTPEDGKREFPAGGWHVEGQMNEHIVATALFYLDSVNISSSSLAFRMQTDGESAMIDDYSVGQDGYHWMEQVYGTILGGGDDPCLQNYGSVETREGRLLAFPNVFQHRVSSFRLIDPTKPGHRRFIALWLVDPNMRIISTANVPPQQRDWWAESIFSSDSAGQAAASSKLPVEILQLLREKGVNVGENEERTGKLHPELLKIVREHFDGKGDPVPMSREEAMEHREKLMDVRSQFHRDVDDEWHENTYNFCEH